VGDERAEREPGDGRGDHLPPAAEGLCPRRRRRRLRPSRRGRELLLALDQPRLHHVSPGGRLLGHGEGQHGAVEAAGDAVEVRRLGQLERLVEPHVPGGTLAADRQPAAGVHLNVEVLLPEPFIIS